MIGMYPLLISTSKSTTKTLNEEKKVDIPIYDYKKEIENLRKQYNNDEIVAILEIPGVLKEPVTQAKDNNYYLTHDLYKKENKDGAIFLDYRINLNDYNKIIIYGHNNLNSVLPFRTLTYYSSKQYYEKHPKIFLYTLDGKKEFDIFSSYKENDNFDYVNLKDFNTTYEKHLNRLKNNSDYKTNIEINKDSKIIILQTCTYTNNKSDGFRLVIGKQI